MPLTEPSHGKVSKNNGDGSVKGAKKSINPSDLFNLKVRHPTTLSTRLSAPLDVKKRKLSAEAEIPGKRQKLSRIVISDNEEALCGSVVSFQAKTGSVTDLRGSKDAPIELDIDPTPGSTQETGIDLTVCDDEAGLNALSEATRSRDSATRRGPEKEDDKEVQSPNGAKSKANNEVLRYLCQKRCQIEGSIDRVHARISSLRSIRDRYLAKQDVLRQKEPKNFTRLPYFKINKKKLVGNTGHLEEAEMVFQDRHKRLREISNKIETIKKARELSEGTIE